MSIEKSYSMAGLSRFCSLPFPPMPSFDVVSEVNLQEVRNARDQAAREVETRFDFKGSNARLEFDGSRITMRAPDEFQLNQMFDILATKLAKRKVNVRSLLREPVQRTVHDARQPILIRRGIDADLARRIVKMVKQTKRKVQVAVQGDQLRVSGKKRDDLQAIIGLLKETTVDRPLQFTNYRD